MERSSIGRRDKTRVHSTRPLVPILFAHPYPDSAEKAFVEAGVYFYKSGEWATDTKNDVWFIDQFNKDTVYFAKINTSNRYHLMRGERIITDLLDEVGYLPVSKGSEKHASYWPAAIQFKVRDDPRVAASADKDTLIINTNRKEHILHPSIYSIKSIFRHEMLHIRDNPIVEAKEANGVPYTYLDHADVYEEQMTYPEFLNAPEDFQINIIQQYALRVFNQYVTKGNNENIKTIRVHLLEEKLRNFNNGTGKLIKARLILQRKQVNKINENTHEIVIYYKGIMHGTVQYKYISSTKN